MKTTALPGRLVRVPFRACLSHLGRVLFIARSILIRYEDSSRAESAVHSVPQESEERDGAQVDQKEYTKEGYEDDGDDVEGLERIVCHGCRAVFEEVRRVWSKAEDGKAGVGTAGADSLGVH